MRKQELLKRIEALEEKVRLLEIALELHEMTKHPAPVVPYWPFATPYPDHWVPPQWPPYPGQIIWTVDNATWSPQTISNVPDNAEVTWVQGERNREGECNVHGIDSCAGFLGDTQQSYTVQ